MIAIDKHPADRLADVLCRLEAVVYTLNALADTGGEDSNALRMLAREVDGTFEVLDEIADSLEAAPAK